LKKVIALFAALAFVIFSALSAFYLDLMIWADHPAGNDPREIIVSVPPGRGFGKIAENLHRAGLLDRPFKFRVLARLKGFDKRIKAGEYQLSAIMSPNRLLEILIKGRVRLYRLTIPEGLTLRQVAAMIERKGFGQAGDFYRAATDPDLIKHFGIPANSLEGYLFPDTYYFPRNVTPRQIIAAMVQRFRPVFSPAWRERAKALGFTVHQIVTLASIIEKETGTGAERPVISSVFHNRLKRRMRLEADPTVIYGIRNFNGTLTRKDLETPTLYNTYKINGLPPGPIANPGFGSLKAALYPADTRFIYFVSRKDGTHHFSTNFRDHRRAVRKYQLRR